MREDGEPSAVKPDLRLLVAGASNVEGMCANAESATNVLEAALRERLPGKTVEALNAGVGSSSFYNYLPVLERYRDYDDLVRPPDAPEAALDPFLFVQGDHHDTEPLHPLSRRPD